MKEGVTEGQKEEGERKEWMNNAIMKSTKVQTLGTI